MTDKQEGLVHKATLDQMVDITRGYHCLYCAQRIHRVPGGSGPTWVHSDTGAVAARTPHIWEGTK